MLKKILADGALGWLSQLSLHLLISAQVMISWFMGWSSMSGSALTVWSLLRILSLPLPLPLPFSLSLSKINKINFFKKEGRITF